MGKEPCKRPHACRAHDDTVPSGGRLPLLTKTKDARLPETVPRYISTEKACQALFSNVKEKVIW